MEVGVAGKKNISATQMTFPHNPSALNLALYDGGGMVPDEDEVGRSDGYPVPFFLWRVEVSALHRKP
jgi:hypothetical protein